MKFSIEFNVEFGIGAGVATVLNGQVDEFLTVFVNGFGNFNEHFTALCESHGAQG